MHKSRKKKNIMIAKSRSEVLPQEACFIVQNNKLSITENIQETPKVLQPHLTNTKIHSTWQIPF
jgi:hypothetical protein